jgi:hypothetical protein
MVSREQFNADLTLPTRPHGRSGAPPSHRARPAEDARYKPRPAMVAIFGGPYGEGTSPWRQHGAEQRHAVPVEPSHPGPMLTRSIALRNVVTGAVLQRVGIGAARAYANVEVR